MNEDRLRILLVDDDEDDYILTHAVLNEFYGDQLDVEWVSSYERAKEALLSGHHHLCLLDYHLGSRTGLELLRETTSCGCTTPVILLTGNDDRDTDVEAMEAGAADYLIKGQFGICLLERSIRYARRFAAQRRRVLEQLRSAEERLPQAMSASG
jgi:two-component system, cell cycle sensor histidine kinase and response regulator CckA